MKSKSVIVLVVPFMLHGVPLNRQAAAQEYFQVSVQQCVLSRKPLRDCLTQSDTVRVKDNRQALLRQHGGIRTLPPQSDLLQELLSPQERGPVAIRITNEKKAEHRIDKQETGLLKELLAEAEMQ